MAGQVQRDDLGAEGGSDVGGVSVWLGGLSGEPIYAHRADVVHYAASMMKLPLLVAAYRRHDRGELDLDRAVRVHNHFASAHDGSGFSLRQADDQDDATWAALGTTVPLRRLARHAAVRSDNLATNLLLAQVGTAALADVLTDAGCSPGTAFVRGIGDSVARQHGLDNHITAGDLGRLLRAVGDRTLAAPWTCIEIEEVLAAQEHRDAIPAGLPRGTWVANKTGWVQGVSHDAALVRPPSRPGYVLVVCVSAPVAERTATAAVAAVSRRVWRHWSRRHG